MTKGQLIGWVGMTGRTTGPHLHYEVRLYDRPMNPRSYLRGELATKKGQTCHSFSPGEKANTSLAFSEL